jgi:hypothetical protein
MMLLREVLLLLHLLLLLLQLLLVLMMLRTAAIVCAFVHGVRLVLVLLLLLLRWHNHVGQSGRPGLERTAIDRMRVGTLLLLLGWLQVHDRHGRGRVRCGAHRGHRLSLQFDTRPPTTRCGSRL